MYKNRDFILAAILALVISFTLFGNGIGGDFVFDDTVVIVGNPVIGDLSKFGEIFTTPYFAYQPRPGLYRPLTIASYSINDLVFGHSPVGFHVVNIFLHALASFLVFVLIYRLACDVKTSSASQIRSKIIPYAGFLFFMFLPIHVEAVTSVVGRAEILALIFIVGAFLLSLNQRYVIASVAFFLGLLSKEIAIAFIPIYLFLEIFRSFGSSISKTWKFNFQGVLNRLYYFIPALIVYAVLRYVALGNYFLSNDATIVYNPIKFTSFLTGLWTSFKVFYLYFEKIFFPVSLSIDYSFNQIPLVENPFFSWQTMAGLLILAILVVAFLRIKNFLFRLGIVMFLSSYFIISNWFFKTGTIMAERLMYLPSLGIAMIIAATVESLKFKVKSYPFDGFNKLTVVRNSNHKLRVLSLSKDNSRFKIINLSLPLFIFYSLLFTLLVWYGYLIIDRNKDWLNSKNLYESAYETAPKSVVNQTNKAYLDFMAGNYEEAEKGLNEVLNIAPEHIPALNLAGQNYKKLGQYQKAEEYWKKAIQLRNDFLRAYLSLGILYYENGYFKSAEKVLTEAVDIYPRWSEVLYLALAKVSLDKTEEAISLIEQHFGGNPSQKQLKFALGWAYLNKGEREKAYLYFAEAKESNVNIDDFVKTFEGSKVILLGVDN